MLQSKVFIEMPVLLASMAVLGIEEDSLISLIFLNFLFECFAN